MLYPGVKLFKKRGLKFFSLRWRSFVKSKTGAVGRFEEGKRGLGPAVFAATVSWCSIIHLHEVAGKGLVPTEVLKSLVAGNHLWGPTEGQWGGSWVMAAPSGAVCCEP